MGTNTRNDRVVVLQLLAGGFPGPKHRLGEDCLQSYVPWEWGSKGVGVLDWPRGADSWGELS